QGQPPAAAATLLLELSLVVALPELRRRPGLVPGDADGLETLHVAEDIQALYDVLRGQADVFQRHALQGTQIGDAGVVNPQRPHRHALEVGQARVAHVRSLQTEARQGLAVLEVNQPRVAHPRLADVEEGKVFAILEVGQTRIAEPRVT